MQASQIVAAMVLEVKGGGKMVAQEERLLMPSKEKPQEGYPCMSNTNAMGVKSGTKSSKEYEQHIKRTVVIAPAMHVLP